MIQEEMHQFAQNQMFLHPEIFDDEELVQKTTEAKLGED
jgi:hypothetical protein